MLIVLSSNPDCSGELLDETKRDLGGAPPLSASLSRDPRFLLILTHFLPEGWINEGLGGGLRPHGRPLTRHCLAHVTSTSETFFNHQLITLFLFNPSQLAPEGHCFYSHRETLLCADIQSSGRVRAHIITLHTNNKASTVGIIDRTFKYIPHLDLKEVRHRGGGGAERQKRGKKRDAFELISCESI